MISQEPKISTKPGSVKQTAVLTLKMNVCLEILLGVRWRYRLDLRYREGFEQADRVTYCKASFDERMKSTKIVWSFEKKGFDIELMKKTLQLRKHSRNHDCFYSIDFG